MPARSDKVKKKRMGGFLYNRFFFNGNKLIKNTVINRKVK